MKTSEIKTRIRALEHTNRCQVWIALDNLKTWANRIEQDLQARPDGVISGLQLKSLNEATAELTYAAGHVNTAILSGARDRANLKKK